MIAQGVWIGGGARRRYWLRSEEAGFAGELQFFVGGDTPFFAVHVCESFPPQKYLEAENGRNAEGCFVRGEKAGK
jgi:hypothetical protein